jgi:hypothetical protein
MLPRTTGVTYQLGAPGRGGTSPGGTPAEGQRGVQREVGPS